MVAISHCLLNVNAKIEGLNPFVAMYDELVGFLREHDIGIIQLPCPETYYAGLKRWGMVKEQYDNPYYRKTCRDLLEPTLIQIKSYIQAGYRVLAVIGIDGSPSCGVNYTGSSSEWKGSLAELEDLDGVVRSETRIPEKGVWMEELERLLDEENISVPFLAVDETHPNDEYQTELKKVLEERTQRK